MRTNHLKALALSVSITLTALASAAAQQQAQAPPPPPSWVGADGMVKPDSAPHEVYMVGRDGKRLRDERGNEKMVPSHIGEAPPPPMR